MNFLDFIQSINSFKDGNQTNDAQDGNLTNPTTPEIYGKQSDVIVVSTNLSQSNTTKPVYEVDKSSLEAPWIRNPWHALRENIIVNSAFLTLCLGCWILSEIKCAGIIRMVYRLKAVISAAAFGLRVLRHCLSYQMKRRVYVYFILAKLFNVAERGSHFVSVLTKNSVTATMARTATSSLHAVESVCSLLGQALSLVLMHELYRCICHTKTRKVSYKKLLAKLAVMALVFVVINGCLMIVRGLVMNQSLAFITFLNVFPVTTGVSAVLSCLMLYFAKCVLLTLRARSNDQTVQRSATNVVHVLVLVCTLACVQLIKLAMPIANTIYISFMIKDHFRCMEMAEKSTFTCYDDTALALSYGDYFGANNIFVLEYVFIIVRMVVEKKEKKRTNEDSGRQRKTADSNE